MTFRKIVVGHDLEDGGRDALALGIELANATGAALLVTKVFPLELAPYRGTEEWRAHEIEELAELIRESDVAGVTADVIASSSRGRGLYELAEEADADLVVIGSSSRGTAERAIVGDVAMGLLHGAACAVAVAPRGYRERPAPIRRITVGYDGSPEAGSALREAFEIARAADATVSIVSVPPPVEHGIGVGGRQRWIAVRQAVEERTRAQLDEARRLAPRDIAVEADLLDGHPATVLIDAAARSDLLILGSRGYGPFRRVLLGSVSAELLRSSSTPVLVFPRGLDTGRRDDPAEEIAAQAY